MSAVDVLFKSEKNVMNEISRY